MPDEAQPLAIVKSYDDLHFALRARADALGVSNDTLNDVAGFFPGYWAHILGPAKPQNSMRTLGRASLSCVLGTLGLKLLVVEDEDAFAKVRDRLVARDNAQYRGGNNWPSSVKPRPRESVFVVLGRAGGYARAAKLTKKQRVKISLKAIRARWSKAR